MENQKHQEDKKNLGSKNPGNKRTSLEHQILETNMLVCAFLCDLVYSSLTRQVVVPFMATFFFTKSEALDRMR